MRYKRKNPGSSTSSLTSPVKTQKQVPKHKSCYFMPECLCKHGSPSCNTLSYSAFCSQLFSKSPPTLAFEIQFRHYVRQKMVLNSQTFSMSPRLPKITILFVCYTILRARIMHYSILNSHSLSTMLGTIAGTQRIIIYLDKIKYT